MNKSIKSLIFHLTNSIGKQFKTLINYANKDKNKAIIYIGNLVIDRFLELEDIDGVEWNIGNNQHWGWLINVFNEIGYMT